MIHQKASFFFVSFFFFSGLALLFFRLSFLLPPPASPFRFCVLRKMKSTQTKTIKKDIKALSDTQKTELSRQEDLVQSLNQEINKDKMDINELVENVER